MSQLTITEALAEIKTINSRLDKKRATVLNYFLRPSTMNDPFEKEGGLETFVAREQQSINDLEKRIISIRATVQKSNNENTLEILGETRTITEWLAWRKEVYPGRKNYLGQLTTKINNSRNVGKQTIVKDPVTEKQGELQIVVGLNESKLLEEIERIEEIYNTLDGKLSLKCATTVIEV